MHLCSLTHPAGIIFEEVTLYVGDVYVIPRGFLHYFFTFTTLHSSFGWNTILGHPRQCCSGGPCEELAKAQRTARKTRDVNVPASSRSYSEEQIKRQPFQGRAPDSCTSAPVASDDATSGCIIDKSVRERYVHVSGVLQEVLRIAISESDFEAMERALEQLGSGTLDVKERVVSPRSGVYDDAVKTVATPGVQVVQGCIDGFAQKVNERSKRLG